MKLAFKLLVTLIFSDIYGQSLNAPVDLLMQLNTAPHGEMENKCRGEQVVNSSDGKLQQCMVDLCGTVDELDSVQLTDENFEEEMKNINLDQFNYLKEDIDSMAEYYQDVNEIIIDNIESRIGKRDSSLLKMAQGNGDSRDYGQYAQMTFEPYLFPQVDLDKPEGERLELVVMPHGKGEAFDKAMQDFKEQHYKKIMSGSWIEKAMNGLHTPEEVFRKADERLVSLRDELESAFGGELPYEVEESFNDIEIFMEDRRYDLYPEDGQQLAFTISYLEETLKESSGEEVYGYEPTCLKGECLNFVKDKLKKIDFSQVVQEYRSGNDKAFNSDETIKNCNNYLLSQSFGSDKSAQTFADKAPEIIENYKKNVLKKFSEETRKKFSNELDKNLNLILPNRIDRMMEAGRVIDGKIGFAEGSLPIPETLSFANDIVIFQLLDQITNEEGKVDPYLPIRNICHAGPFVTATDAFLPLKAIEEFPEMMMEMPMLDDEKSNVFVSPFSCEHVHHGKDIFSHELSHFVSFLFHENGGEPSSDSHAKFLEMRKCAQEVMIGAPEPFTMPSVFKHEGDLRTTEEDTADMLAFMAYPDSKTPFTCSMLFKHPEGGYNLREEDKNRKGQHSFVPFRILNEAIQKNIPLSESCRGFMQDSKEEIVGVQCLK